MAADDSSSVFRWKLLTDGAVSSAADDLFGQHSAFATLLYKLAVTCDTPFTVALYAGWGAGKSSVAGILREKILADNPRRFGYVYLDVWKFSSDPLKRWILLEVNRQLVEQSILDPEYTFDGRDLESHLEFEDQWSEEAELKPLASLGWKLQGAIWTATVLFAALSALLFSVSDRIPQFLKITPQLLETLSGAGLLAGILVPLLRWFLDYLRKIGFRRVQWFRTVKPAFSSEKFGAIFQDMISKAAKLLPDRKLVLVFDNLDRCSEAVAVEAISVIKTYLDVPGCVYIVPCDQAALVRHVSKSYTNSLDGNDARAYATEYLNKFFQMTLRLPPPMEFDLEAFIDKQLERAGMDDLPPDARDVLVLGYRGETPRQIKRILNDLVGYLALGGEAEAEQLVGKGELTKDLAFVTKMSVISANWPDFLDKLAANPELWLDIKSRLQQPGHDIAGLVPDAELAEFLRRTRYTSPEADIRPYLYIKRAPYEKDALLRRRVESSLRNGEVAEYDKIIAAAVAGPDLNNVLDMTERVVRNWRVTFHPNFVLNASPIIIKTSAKYASHWALLQEARSVLEFACTNAPVQKLGTLFQLNDVFSLISTASRDQRRIVTTKYAQFLDGHSGVINRGPLLAKYLANAELLDSETKMAVSGAILSSYRAATFEAEDLEMLSTAGEAAERNRWIVHPDLLELIATRVDYSGSVVDSRRLRVLAQFQDFMTDAVRTHLLSKLSQFVPAAPVAEVPGQTAHFTEALRSFNPKAFEKQIALLECLVVQLEGHRVAERVPWLRPLLVAYQALDKPRRDRVDDAIQKSILANDPQADAFLSGLDANDWRLLFEVAGVESVLRAEPAYLESEKGMPQAASTRQQHLSHVPLVIRATKPGIFDDRRKWDVVLQVEMIDRAFQEGTVDIGTSMEEFTAIARRDVDGDLTANRQVFEALARVAEKGSDNLAASFAKAMVDWSIRYLESSFADYPTFQSCLSKLDPDERLAKMNYMVDHCLVSPRTDRAPLLTKVVAHVCSDDAVKSAVDLVSKVFDVAYQEAVGQASAEATVALLQLSDNLSNRDRQDYLARSLDRLTYLEAGDSKMEQMEPFLRLLSKNQAALGAESRTKQLTFLKRMLSPASEKARKLRALDLLADSSVPQLRQDLQDELSELANSQDVDIALKGSELTGVRKDARPQ